MPGLNGGMKFKRDWSRTPEQSWRWGHWFADIWSESVPSGRNSHCKVPAKGGTRLGCLRRGRKPIWQIRSEQRGWTGELHISSGSVFGDGEQIMEDIKFHFIGIWLYPEWNGEPLQTFKNGSDRLGLIFQSIILAAIRNEV